MKKMLLTLSLILIMSACQSREDIAIALIEKEFVEKTKWLNHDEFMDLVVIAESTPGPIAINCATYTGYKKAGFLGAAFAANATNTMINKA